MDQTSRLIKKRQKESFLFREIVNIMSTILIDEKKLTGLFPTRASLSDDKSNCTFYFVSENPEDFPKQLEILKLYKPSIRSSLSKSIKSRYTPDIAFAYDQKYQEQLELDAILDKIKDK